MYKTKKIFIVTILMLLLTGCAPAIDSSGQQDSNTRTIDVTSENNPVVILGANYLDDYEVVCFTAQLYNESISVDCIPINQLNATVTMGLK